MTIKIPQQKVLAAGQKKRAWKTRCRRLTDAIVRGMIVSIKKTMLVLSILAAVGGSMRDIKTPGCGVVDAHEETGLIRRLVSGIVCSLSFAVGFSLTNEVISLSTRSPMSTVSHITIESMGMDSGALLLCVLISVVMTILVNPFPGQTLESLAKSALLQNMKVHGMYRPKMEGLSSTDLAEIHCTLESSLMRTTSITIVEELSALKKIDGLKVCQMIVDVALRREINTLKCVQMLEVSCAEIYEPALAAMISSCFTEIWIIGRRFINGDNFGLKIDRDLLSILLSSIIRKIRRKMTLAVNTNIRRQKFVSSGLYSGFYTELSDRDHDDYVVLDGLSLVNDTVISEEIYDDDMLRDLRIMSDRHGWSVPGVEPSQSSMSEIIPYPKIRFGNYMLRKIAYLGDEMWEDMMRGKSSTCEIRPTDEMVEIDNIVSHFLRRNESSGSLDDSSSSSGSNKDSGSYKKDLTREGIEPNPGPTKLVVRSVSDSSFIASRISQTIRDIDFQDVSGPLSLQPVTYSITNQTMPVLNISHVTIPSMIGDPALDSKYDLTIEFPQEYLMGSSHESLKEDKLSEVFTSRQLSRAPHDMVCYGIAGERGDFRLTDPETQRFQTPDFLYLKDDVLTVLEVGTKRRDGDKSEELFAEYTKKLENYSLLMDRVSKATYLRDDGSEFKVSVVFMCIIVGDREIVSNMSLSDDSVNMLSAHKKAGMMIKDYGLRNGLMSADATADYTKTIRQQLSSAVSSLASGSEEVIRKLEASSEDTKGLITMSLIETWDRESRDGLVFRNNLKDITVNLAVAAAVETKFYIKDVEKRTLKDCEDKINSFMKDASDLRMHIDPRIEMSETMADTLNDRFQPSENRKPISVLPLLIPLVENMFLGKSGYEQIPMYNLKRTDLPSFMAENHMTRLWRSAVDRVKVSEEENHNMENLELLREMSEMSKEDYEKKDKTGRRDRSRVKIDISDEDWMMLGKDGVSGKHLRDEPIKLVKHAVSKLPFRMTHDTSDISEFISNETLFEEGARGWEQLGQIHGIESSGPAGDFNRSIMRTKVGTALIINGLILEEVNLGFRQFCVGDEMLFKKLRGADIYLLIKPTSQDGHIFFSLCWRRSEFSSYNSPFRNTSSLCKMSDEWEYTEFVSVNRHRIHSLVFSHCHLPAYVALFCELKGILPDSFLEGVSAGDHSSLEVMKHSLFMILALYEGKAETASTLQTIRYAYCEIARSKDLYTDPMKVLEKMSKIPRSRLYVWILNQFVKTFKTMVAVRPYLTPRVDRESDSNKNGDNYTNLLSWITGHKIRTMAEAINISYCGIVRNKDDSVKIHGLFKIFSKIIKEEMSLKDSRPEYCGYKDNKTLMTNDGKTVKSTYRSHEFSPTVMRESGHLIKDYIKKTRGVAEMDWENFCMETMASAIRTKTSDQYATFKASASRSASLVFEPNEGDMPSIRALEGVSKYLDDDTIREIPLLHIENLLVQLESEGGVFATLFKKDQTTGTREIFILEMLSRLVVNFVETFARSMCELIPSEMLTKGTTKYGRNSVHMARVEKARRATNFDFLTITNSDDATTWAQKWIMPAFAAFCHGLMPRPLYMIIVRILNMVAKKTLRMPHDLLKIFSDKPNIWSTDEGMNEVKRQFLNQGGDHNLIDHHLRVLKNVSNMMQGILHYISSLAHAGHIMYLESVIKEVFVEKIQKRNPDSRLEQSADISSDDSATSTTVLGPSEDMGLIRHFLIWSGCLKKISYPLMCMKQSYEKSTPIIFAPFKEFNSLWYIYNTMVSPKIKFVVGSLQMMLESSIDSRQIAYSNLRRQLVENGGSQYLASVIQESQKVIHYTCLGMNATPLFRQLVKNLDVIKHPSLGYFLSEPEMLCGIFGYGFAEYLLYRSNVNSRRILQQMLTSGDFEINDDGRPTMDFSMSFGNLDRYQQFKDRMMQNRMENWEEEPLLSGRVYAYFEQARTKEDCVFSICKKVHSLGARDVFSFKTGSMILASSAYCLHTPCLTVTKYKNIDGVKTRIVVKTSLLAAMKDMTEAMLTVDEVEMSSLRILFQNTDLYDMADTMEKEVRDNSTGSFSKVGFRPERFLTMSAERKYTIASRSLMETIKNKWLGSSTMNENELEYCWDSYTSQDFFKKTKGGIGGGESWLKSTFEETLNHPDCPFKEPIKLANFIKNVDPKRSSFKLLAHTRSNLPIIRILEDIMRTNYVKGHYLKASSDVTQSDDIGYGISPNFNISDALRRNTGNMREEDVIFRANFLEGFNSDLVLMSEYENSTIDKEKLIERMFKSEIKFNFGESVNHLPQNLRMLCYIIDFMKISFMKRSRTGFNAILQKADFGDYGLWIVPQEYDQDTETWYGKGEYRGVCNRASYRIFVEDDMVIKMETNNQRDLMLGYRPVGRLVRKLGWRGMIHKISSSGTQYLDIKTGRAAQRQSASTCPLIITEGLKPPSLEEEQIKVKVIFRNGVLSIVPDTKDRASQQFRLRFYADRKYLFKPRSNGPSVLCDMMIKTENGVVSKRDQFSGIMDYSMYWFKCLSCPVVVIRMVIKNLRSSMSESVKNKYVISQNGIVERTSDLWKEAELGGHEKVKISLQASLLERLRMKSVNVGSSDMGSRLEEAIEEDEENKTLPEMYDEDEFATLLNQMSPVHSDDEDEEHKEESDIDDRFDSLFSMSEIASSMDNFAKEESKSQVTAHESLMREDVLNSVPNMAFILPFWDDFLAICSSELKIGSISEILNSTYRIPMPVDSNLELLTWLLDQDQKPTQQSESSSSHIDADLKKYIVAGRWEDIED